MSSYEIGNDDKIKSALIKVQALKEEYEVTLQQYREAGQNFITILQREKLLNPNTKKFVALKGRTWWGTKALSENTVSNQKECENMCAESDKCSGATFNSVNKYCWTRSGESDITVGNDNDYALITEEKSVLSTMKYLNNKLLELNVKMSEELKNINPEVKQQYEEKEEKNKELNTSYDILLKQKIALDEELQKYYSTLDDETNQSYFVNQQHLSYKFWMVITLLVLIITIQIMFGSQLSTDLLPFWLIFASILIILAYNLTSPSGFLVFCMFLLFLFLYMTGNLPFMY